MKVREVRDEQVFRSPHARTLAGVWFATAAFLAYDTVDRGSGRNLWISLAALGAISVAVYALAWRPAVVADSRGVTLRNIVRDVVVPWGRVERIGSKWSLTIDTAERSWPSWAITARNRERSAFSRGGTTAREPASPPAPQSGESTALVSEELSRRWQASAGGAEEGEGDVVVRWVWAVIAALAVSLLALMAALTA